MTTSNNVVSFNDTVTAAVKRELTAGLENRGGNWVSEPFLLTMVDRSLPDGITVKSIVDEMVQAGDLAKTFHTASDKMDRVYQLPLYRLEPKW